MSAHTASNTPPAPFPGETFLSTWTNLKFFLGAPDPSASTWATLAAFYGTGTVHLSTCRLVFVLDPPPPPTAITPHTLSIPLVWLQRDRLRLCRPFFDADHLAGVLVPADLDLDLELNLNNLNSLTNLTNLTNLNNLTNLTNLTNLNNLNNLNNLDLSSAPPPARPRVFSPPGKPMRFRIEALNPAHNHSLCSELRDLLADPDRVARDTRALRHAADTHLIPTDAHYAFVDPRNPAVLHLATLMAQPHEPDLIPH